MKTVAMSKDKKLTTRNGAPVVDNQNTMTAGTRGPVLLQVAPHTL
jgi:catalase